MRAVELDFGDGSALVVDDGLEGGHFCCLTGFTASSLAARLSLRAVG